MQITYTPFPFFSGFCYLRVLAMHLKTNVPQASAKKVLNKDGEK